MSYCGVRRRASGHFASEITCEGEWKWLGTFETPELAAHVYDVVAVRYGRSLAELNFPEVSDHVDSSPLPWSSEEMAQRRAKATCYLHMTKVVLANPKPVVAELAFYAKKEVERLKKDEEHQRSIDVEVNGLFDQIDREGCFDEEKEVKPSTGNVHSCHHQPRHAIYHHIIIAHPKACRERGQASLVLEERLAITVYQRSRLQIERERERQWRPRSRGRRPSATPATRRCTSSTSSPPTTGSTTRPASGATTARAPSSSRITTRSKGCSTAGLTLTSSSSGLGASTRASKGLQRLSSRKGMLGMRMLLKSRAHLLAPERNVLDATRQSIQLRGLLSITPCTTRAASNAAMEGAPSALRTTSHTRASSSASTTTPS